jgi:hypothetical protein
MEDNARFFLPGIGEHMNLMPVAQQFSAQKYRVSFQSALCQKIIFTYQCDFHN